MQDDSGHSVHEEHVTIRELAFLAGTRTRIIERLVTLELLQPARERPEPVFPSRAAHRVRKLMRLHFQLGVSWTSMPLVLELLERIEQLEDRLGE